MLQRAGCIVQQRQKPCQLWEYLYKPWTDPLLFPGTDAGSDRAPFRLHCFPKAGQVIHCIVDKRPRAHCYLSLSPTAPGGSRCSKSITCLLAKSNILPLEGNRCYFVFSSFESAHNALHPQNNWWFFSNRAPCLDTDDEVLHILVTRAFLPPWRDGYVCVSAGWRGELLLSASPHLPWSEKVDTTC